MKPLDGTVEEPSERPKVGFNDDEGQCSEASVSETLVVTG